jgi:hypothetical protein
VGRHPRDLQLLAGYAATRWQVDMMYGSAVVAPGTPAPPPLRPAAIVTAFNPASHPASPDANARADAALRARLDAASIAWHRTRAIPADGAAEWTEPGYALPGIDRQTAVRLGDDFGQNAIVWIDPDGRVSLVATLAGFCGLRLGDEIPIR